MAIGVLASASPAASLDYGRNDVRGRELGLTVMRAPTADTPMAVALRASARRHARFFYLGASAFVGTTFTPQPLLMLSGAFGLESADDAFRRVRGYGEVGTGLFFANDARPLYDLLTFHVETGLRVHLRTWARPHWQATIGFRLLTNFRHVGLMGMVGTDFTFD